MQKPDEANRTTIQPLLSQTLEQLGATKQILSGQTPFLLDQPDQLFHVVRVARREIIPNVSQFQDRYNPESNHMVFLAVGVIGTEILTVSYSALANQPQSVIAKLLDNWIINATFPFGQFLAAMNSIIQVLIGTLI